MNSALIEDQIRRHEMRDFYRYELRSQLREWRIRITGSAWIFLAFTIAFMSAEMVKAICVCGFITAFGLHLFSWTSYRSVSRELGSLR